MNVLSRRAVRRAGIGAVALAVSAAVAGIASPAHAATPADLAVTVDSSKIAAGSSGKFFVAKVKNIGGTATVGLSVKFQTAGLDPDKIAAAADGCATAGSLITCSFDTVLIEPDATIEVPIRLTPKAGATGDAGSLEVSASSAGATADPDGNNTALVDHIMIEGGGADLVVVAFDVYALDDDDAPVGPVKPGDDAKLFVFVGNFGDQTVTKWKITTVLPQHVSFGSTNDELCDYSADLKTETCTLSGDEWKLDPGEAFGDGFHNPVKVAADAPGPVNLTGGTVTVAVIEETEPPVFTIKSAPGPNRTTTDDKAFDSVDPGDNTDTYTVFVGPKPAGGGGTLPITGAKAGLIGGAGAAALVVGALLFLMARRRRVVLVTPTDV